MRFPILYAVALALALLANPGQSEAPKDPNIASTKPRTPEEELNSFHLPPGMPNAFPWGFDGWVYAGHGFSNTSSVKGADGSAITMQSGNTYRMKVDGSHIELFTHGQVNPFGLCFDPLGNLFSADCHTKP